MSQDFQEYRFARIEAQKITRARLDTQFKDGLGSVEELEKAIEQLLTTEASCTPWRTSEVEQLGSREGTRMAALEFYWDCCRHSSGPESERSRGPFTH